MTVLRPVSIDHFRDLAHDYLPAFISDYIDTGGGSGVSQQRNLAAFDRYTFVPRSLVDVTSVVTERTIFGRKYALPFGITAMGNVGFIRRHADQILAETARAANIPFILSSMANAAIEEIARLAPNHAWYQFYAPRDGKIADDLIGRAWDAGVSVLVVTVDFPVPPRSEGARRGVSWTAGPDWTMWRTILSDVVRHPRWTFNYLAGGNAPRMEGWARYAPEGSDRLGVTNYFESIWPLNLLWSDLEKIRRQWPGKLVIKGLLHPEDVARTFGIGADAVTISNHGGNKLDCIPASVDMLATAKPPLAPDATVFLDSGIRKGSDVLTALALGADFCFVGRAALFGVAVDGARGARRIIEILASEVKYVQAMIGVSTCDQLSREMLLQDGRRL